MKRKWCQGYSPLCVNLNDIHVLQLLKNVTSNSTTAFTEMRWTTAIPLASSIDPSEGTNTKTPPQVDLPCHGSYSTIELKMQSQYTIIVENIYMWLHAHIFLRGERERETHTSSNVVPIWVIWSKFLKCCSLNKISPFRQLNLLENMETERKHKNSSMAQNCCLHLQNNINP